MGDIDENIIVIWQATGHKLTFGYLQQSALAIRVFRSDHGYGVQIVVYITDRKGPKIEPWDTPILIF